MAGGCGSSGSATTEQFIFRAQKSTNHLKALLAKLLPAAGGGHGTGAECSGSAVDALLSDITDSLSQAKTSLRFCTAGLQTATGSTTARRSKEGGAGGRRSAPRRSGQRVRMDGHPRVIVLQNGVHDSYTWRKYGQKEILGTKFPRSYYKCCRKSGCPAKKHVQQYDADPSKLEITYFLAHTCDDPPPPLSSHSVPDATVGSDAPATVPPAQCYVGRPPSPSPVPYATTTGSKNILKTTSLLPPVAWYDLVPDVTACTPSLEQELGDLLLIPSPACSQSELLPVDVPSLAPHGLPLSLEHTLACDFAVPEL